MGIYSMILVKVNDKDREQNKISVYTFIVVFGTEKKEN